MELYFVLGFLGSGKTTLLKKLITHFNGKGKKLAVIVNDFGSKDVDGLLMRTAGNLMTVTDGSLFCSCRIDQFLKNVKEASILNPDVLLVESSGLSNPSNMLEVLSLVNAASETKVNYRGAVCLCDAGSFEKVMSTVRLTKAQVAFADAIIINKADTASLAGLKRVSSLIREYNDKAPIYECSYAETDINQLLSFTPQKKYREIGSIMDINTQKVTLSFKEFDFKLLNNFCKILSETANRIKGVLNIGGISYVYQNIDGTYTLTEIEAQTENYLIILAVTGKSLKAAVNDALGKNPFIVEK